MAIEMVVGEVQPQRDPRPERRRRLELEAARLDDVDRVRRRLRRPARSAARRCCRRPAPCAPAASSIRPISVVVVDFPFVPVIGDHAARSSQRDASSSSPMISTPVAPRAVEHRLARAARPGSTTIRSAAGQRRRVVAAELERRRPASRRRSAPSNAVARLGQHHARAPAHEQLRGRDAAARRADHHHPAPVDRERRRVPTPSPQLQRRQAEQREDDRDDQEARDDLRLAPADAARSGGAAAPS